MWIGITGEWTTQNWLWLKLGLAHAPAVPPKPWNPPAQFGAGAALAWLFIVVRVAGSTLVVPPLEEVFFRSFLYRYIAKVDFLSVPLGRFAWMPFLVDLAAFSVSSTRNGWRGFCAGLPFKGW